MMGREMEGSGTRRSPSVMTSLPIEQTVAFIGVPEQARPEIVVVTLAKGQKSIDTGV